MIIIDVYDSKMKMKFSYNKSYSPLLIKIISHLHKLISTFNLDTKQIFLAIVLPYT